MALEDPKTLEKLKTAAIVVLVALVLLDPKLLEAVHILEHDPHHAAYFVVDGWPGFYVVYGFLTCWAMVMLSKKLVAKLLMRPDTYYDRSPLDPTRDAKGRRLRDVH
jgi:hypothetical protein